MVRSLLLKFISKLLPKKKELPLPAAKPMPLNFHCNTLLPPEEILSTNNMSELFRFENTYHKNYGEDPETIVVGHKDGNVFFARVMQSTDLINRDEKLQGRFVLEQSSVSQFCDSLDALLRGEWDSPSGNNYFKCGKDRILMNASYPREVPSVTFYNYRSHSIDGEDHPASNYKTYMKNYYTRIEARLILDQLRNTILG